jgi:hypothetical protein
MAAGAPAADREFSHMKSSIRFAALPLALTALLFASTAPVCASVPDFLSADNDRRVINSVELLTRDRIYSEGGAWYNPSQSGSGWYFSTLSASSTTRLMTGALFGYESTGTGRANWYVTGGVEAPRFDAALAPMFRGDPLATWEAPLFEGSGGPCPTCAYAPPNVRPSTLGGVRVRWMSPTEATVEISGVTVAPIIHADMVLQSDLYARLVGFHTGLEQSWLLRDPNGSSTASIACRFDFRPTANPASGNVWRAAAGVPAQSLPHAEARWLKIWKECTPAFGTGPTTPRDSGIFVAVPPQGAGQVAVALQVDDVAGQEAPVRITNTVGAVVGFELGPRSLTGRVFSSGANEVTYAGKLNHDVRSLDRVMSMSR